MDRKEEHAMALQSAQARAAKQEYILKGPKPKTHSATMPAYCYTAMCLLRICGSRSGGGTDVNRVSGPRRWKGSALSSGSDGRRNAAGKIVIVRGRGICMRLEVIIIRG